MCNWVGLECTKFYGGKSFEAVKEDPRKLKQAAEINLDIHEDIVD
jgi:hypothetical protein